jgi:hypothetical protein
MTGQIRWAVYGGIAVAAGIALLLRAKYRATIPQLYLAVISWLQDEAFLKGLPLLRCKRRLKAVLISGVV